MCVGVDKVDGPSVKICKKFQGDNKTESRFPFCFDVRLSSRSVIRTDRSRLGEQTRALVGLLQSSVGRWRRNTIHMFYRQDLKGVVNAIKRQKSSPRPTNTSTFLPTSFLPLPVLTSDPAPGDQARPSFDTKCLTVVVNVLVEQLKVLDRAGRRGGGGRWCWCSRARRNENDLSCCRTDPTARQSSGARRARIRVQVIAGWIWDRRLRQMRIIQTLWSEEQEAFIASGQWLVLTGRFSLQIFSSLSARTP